MIIELKITEDCCGDISHDLKISEDTGEVIDTVSISPLWENPEDATIGRDLLDGEDLIDFITLGYKAGINREKLKISRHIENENTIEMKFLDKENLKLL